MVAPKRRPTYSRLVRGCASAALSTASRVRPLQAARQCYTPDKSKRRCMAAGHWFEEEEAL
jgi:hypothetical protein